MGIPGSAPFQSARKSLIGSPGLGCISCQHKRPTQLQVSQRSDGVAENDPPVIQYLLKLSGRLKTVSRLQIGFASYIDRIEGPAKSGELALRYPSS